MKRIKTIFQFFIASFIMSCFGCYSDDNLHPQSQCLSGNDVVINQTINLPTDISGFNLSIAANVILAKGETQEIKIIAEQNIIDNIETKVSDGIWDIKYDECVDSHRDITIFITMATLEKITVTGVGYINTINTFDQLNDLEIIFTGTGSIDLNIAAKQVNTTLSGAGDIVLSGTTETQDITLSGTGHFKGFNLSSNICNVLLTGVGNCEVLVNGALNVTITGVGNVSYKGDPDVTATITGTGKLINAN